jgi:hypothetical protein
LDPDTEIDSRTLIERMTDAGIDPDKARRHIQDGWVRLNGEYATSPDQPGGKPLRYVIQPPGPTTEGENPVRTADPAVG